MYGKKTRKACLKFDPNRRCNSLGNADSCIIYWLRPHDLWSKIIINLSVIFGASCPDTSIASLVLPGHITAFFKQPKASLLSAIHLIIWICRDLWNFTQYRLCLDRDSNRRSSSSLHYSQSCVFCYSNYGGETDVSLNFGRFYGPIVRPRMRMNEWTIFF
jgi:hypothetical protein